MRQFLTSALVYALLATISNLMAQPTGLISGYGYGKSHNAIVNLSDGTILVAAGGADLNWVPRNVPIDTLIIPRNRKSAADTTVFGIASSAPGQIGYLMHLSADYQQLLRITAMPAGLVPDVVKIKSTNVPGATTGAIFISGRRDHASVKGYYILKLNGNYLGGNHPTAAEWTFDVRSLDRRHNMGAASPFPAGVESDVRKYQPWDVTAEGKVYFVLDREFSDDWCAIHRLRTDGRLDIVENWRVHWTGDGTQSFNRGPSMRFTPASSYSGPGQLASSGIILKLNRNGHLRSATQQEFDSLMTDENGNSGRKGSYPDDFLYDAPLAFTDPNFAPASNPGYTGMSPNFNGNNTATPRCVALTVDRTNGDLYFGYSVYSTSTSSGVHDFEPAVVAMDSSGRKKWWARCYQTTSAQSNAQQHIDHLAIDYTNKRLVVAGRTYGDCANNFWAGNALALNPGGKGFMNRFTGMSHSNYISWLGIFGATGHQHDGKILKSTFIGEAADTLIGRVYQDLRYDQFPNVDSTIVPLANTETEDLYPLADGRIVWAGKANRAMTTTDAAQPMLKFGEGHVRPQSMVRIYSAGLDTVHYSSMVSTVWNELIKGTSQPVADLRIGASNSSLGLNLYVIGKQFEAGNIGLENKPSWADSVARLDQGSIGLLMRLPIAHQTAPLQPLSRPDTIWSSLQAGTCAGQSDTFKVRSVPGMQSVIWSLGTGWTGYSRDTILIARSLPTATQASYLTVAYSDGYGRSKQKTIVLAAPARPAGAVTQISPQPAGNLLCIGQPFSLSSRRTGNILRYEFTASVTAWQPTSTTDTSASYIVPPLTDTSAVFIRAVNSCGAGPWRKVNLQRPLAKPDKPVIRDSSGFLVSSVSAGIQWYESGQPIAGATTRRITSRAGAFTVIATNRCGTDTSLVFNVVSLADGQTGQQHTLNVYPNPLVGKHLHLHTNRPINGAILYDALGRAVTQWPNLEAGTHQLEIVPLRSGVYTLVADGRQQRIVVQ